MGYHRIQSEDTDLGYEVIVNRLQVSGVTVYNFTHMAEGSGEMTSLFESSDFGGFWGLSCDESVNALCHCQIRQASNEKPPVTV